MSAPSTISIDKLVRLIGTPKCPMLVDVRPQEDFEADPHLIPSAFHCALDKLEDRIESVGAQAAVVICQDGSDVSQGAAALLRHNGVAAEVLAGGFQAGGRRGFHRFPLPSFPVLIPRDELCG
jgi:rhodanese-related sulfurtransferase